MAQMQTNTCTANLGEFILLQKVTAGWKLTADDAMELIQTFVPREDRVGQLKELTEHLVSASNK